MASWMVHLRVADKLLDKINGLKETEFIVGNIAPDSGAPSADWSTFTPNKTVSHFMCKCDNGKLKINSDEYKNRYLKSRHTIEEYSFHLGYFSHLLTDILWKNIIIKASVDKDHEAYSNDPNGTVWKWKKDWYDLDFLFIRENPEFRAFKIFEQAKGFKNDYLDIFSEDAFDNRREYITGFYRAKRENLDREYPYLTKNQMDDFTDEAVNFILKEFNNLDL